MRASSSTRLWLPVVPAVLMGMAALFLGQPGPVNADRVAPRPIAPVRPAGYAPWAAGGWVSVAVEVEGRPSPLYSAVDGSGRFYVEARRGSRYALQLTNRTGERLAVEITVDGLNVISGERDLPAGAPSGQHPGRMYVLDPWESARIQGWRTSLDDVRLFNFVDEERSYATRAGKANARMGWIEMAVYREQRRVSRVWPLEGQTTGRDEEAKRQDRDQAGSAGSAAPPPTAAPSARGKLEQAPESATADAYPGTGWGPRANDRVSVVDFQPLPYPTERVTLRYEYAPALRALGLLPGPGPDRLSRRERGEEGFAKPPVWD